LTTERFRSVRALDETAPALGGSCAGNRDLAWQSGQTLLVSDTRVRPQALTTTCCYYYYYSTRLPSEQRCIATGIEYVLPRPTSEGGRRPDERY